MKVPIALALVSLCSCGESDAVDRSSVAPSTPSMPEPAPKYAWIELPLNVQTDAEVMRHANEARALGLEPIVHLRTPWNSASRLARHRDTLVVQSALEGLYLIEVIVDDVWLEEWDGGRSKHWTPKLLCGTFANSLNAVDRNGHPMPPHGSPGKNGPESAEENARMLREFRALLAGPGDSSCVSLRFSP